MKRIGLDQNGGAVDFVSELDGAAGTIDHVEAQGDVEGGEVRERLVLFATEEFVPPEREDGAGAADPTPGRDPILLYNGDCAVCRKISAWVIRNDDPNNGGWQAIDERPIGSDPEALKAIDPRLDIWDVYSKIHLIMPDGTILKGGDAVAEVFRRLPDTNWFTPVLKVHVGDFYPFQVALNFGYEVLDKIRPALGCETCGGDVPTWAKPIAWIVSAIRTVRSWFGGSSEPAQPSGPAA